MLNKKANEKVMSLAYVLYLILIGTGVIIIVAQYVGSPVDIKPLETTILYTNLMECFVKNGFVDNAVFDDKFDVYSYCHLNRNILDPSEGRGDVSRDFFWFNISFFDEEGVKVRDSLVGGNTGYQSDCLVMMGKTSANFPYCIFKNESYFFMNKNGEYQRVKIVALVASFNTRKKEVLLLP